MLGGGGGLVLVNVIIDNMHVDTCKNSSAKLNQIL